MASLNSEQTDRAKEFQADIANLTDTDFHNSQFTQWVNSYWNYVMNGLAPSGQHPPHRPGG